MMSGKETHKMAVYLLSLAQGRAHLTGFTFDYLPLSTALVEAAQRGVDVTCCFDHQHVISGATTAMPERLNDLRKGGVRVCLCRGVNSGMGTQHSKTLLVDDYMIVGSSNWTNATRNNQELSVLIRVTGAGRDAWDKRLGFMMHHGTEFTEEHFVRGLNSRKIIRSKSSGPEKYATAKRFSIARGRSLRAAEAAAMSGAGEQGCEPSLEPAAPAASRWTT